MGESEKSLSHSLFKEKRPSGSSLYFYGINPVVMRKVNVIFPEKLMREHRWLSKHQNFDFVVQVFSEGSDYYDLEYIDGGGSLAQLALTATGDVALATFKKALAHIQQLHGKSKTVKVKNLAAQYLHQKLFTTLDKLANSSSEVSSLIRTPKIEVNGKFFNNFYFWKEILLSNIITDIFSEIEVTDPHGDLTLENILYDKEAHIKLIDPNGNNILPDVLLDYGKILQSLNSKYELLFLVNDLSIRGHVVNYSLPENHNYNLMYKHLLGNVFSNWSAKQVFRVYLHELIHLARLLPHQLRVSPKRFPLFYVTFLQRLSEFYETQLKNRL